MRIRDLHAAEEEPINLTSMLDMVFNLLIFFLVATTVSSEEMDVGIRLPSSPDSGIGMVASAQSVIVNIAPDGMKTIAGKVYDKEELAKFLKSLADSGQTVLIRADRNARHGDVADVLTLCREVGIGEAKIGYAVE